MIDAPAQTVTSLTSDPQTNAVSSIAAGSTKKDNLSSQQDTVSTLYSKEENTNKAGNPNIDYVAELSRGDDTIY